MGKVTVTTTDGRELKGFIEEPKGDPGNTLSRAELTDKAQRLAAYSGWVGPDEMAALVARVWGIAKEARIGFLLSLRESE